MSSTTDPGQSVRSPIAAPPNFPVVWERPEDARLLWTLDRVHFPESMLPLDYAVFGDAFAEGTTRALRSYGMPIRFLTRRINTYRYEAREPIASSAEEAAGRAKLDAAMARLAELWAGEWLPEVQRHLAFWEGFDLPGAPTPALLAHLDDTLARVHRLWEIHALVGAPALMAVSMFDDLHRDLFGGTSAIDAYRLLQGLPSKTIENGQALWRLSRAALERPGVRRVLAERPTSEVVGALAASPEGRAFLAELRAYLDAYGHGGDRWLLSHPGWVEDPTPVIKNVQDYVDRSGDGPEAGLVALAAERERLVAEARQRLTGHPPPVAERFAFLLRAAQEGIVLKEDHNFWIDCRALHRVRRVFLELGRRLSAAGATDRPDDVWYLTPQELRETGAAPARVDRRGLVAGRRAEVAYFRTVTPPPALGTPPPDGPADTPIARLSAKLRGPAPTPHSDPTVLRGLAASPGTARGAAKVVRSLAEAAKLRPGDVLVAETTAPPWTPLFATIGALVTDTGGVLSHGAVVAREYRLPAVTGTGTATAVIRDGQLLEVDGDAGVVRLIPPP